MIFTVFIQFFYLTSFITPMLAPFFYKCKNPVIVDLFRRMTVQPNFRKLYMRLLTLYLLAFHFYHLTLFNHPTWLIPSTFLTLLTYYHFSCEKMFNLIQNQRVFLGCLTFAVLCMIVPAFLPLGFTILMISVAAVFYPSKLLRNAVMTIAEKRQLWWDYPEDAVLKYFRWDLMENVDTNKVYNFHPDAIEDAEFTDIEN
jgi:hypothetical protein